MDRNERDKICKTCINHKVDDRYGIICGLTNNFANFIGECKDYSKTKTIAQPKQITSRDFRHKPKRKKKSFGSLVGGGVLIWFLIKLILKVLKYLTQ